jgi:hypothetical protein
MTSPQSPLTALIRELETTDRKMITTKKEFTRLRAQRKTLREKIDALLSDQDRAVGMASPASKAPVGDAAEAGKPA